MMWSSMQVIAGRLASFLLYRLTHFDPPQAGGVHVIGFVPAGVDGLIRETGGF